MKYRVLTTKAFEKSLKLCQKRGYPMDKLELLLGWATSLSSIFQKPVPQQKKRAYLNYSDTPSIIR